MSRRRKPPGHDSLPDPAWRGEPVVAPVIAVDAPKILRGSFSVVRLFFDDLAERSSGGQVGELARLVDKARRAYDDAARLL